MKLILATHARSSANLKRSAARTKNPPLSQPTSYSIINCGVILRAVVVTISRTTLYTHSHHTYRIAFAINKCVGLRKVMVTFKLDQNSIFECMACMRCGAFAFTLCVYIERYTNSEVQLNIERALKPQRENKHTHHEA